MRKLDDILPDDVKQAKYRFVKDVFGIPLEVTGITFSKDDRGFKATFECNEVGKPGKFYVSTRALQPLKVGSFVVKGKLLPFSGKFISQGQAVALVDNDTPWTPEDNNVETPF